MITIGYSTREIDDDFIELLKKSVGLPGVKIIPVKNNGEYSLTEVYNKILSESQTDIVVLCHDDIYFDTKNWGQKIINHFKRNNEYVQCCTPFHIWSKKLKHMPFHILLKEITKDH